MKTFKVIAINEPEMSEDYDYDRRMRAYIHAENINAAREFFHYRYSSKRWEIESIIDVTDCVVFGINRWEPLD